MQVMYKSNLLKKIVCFKTKYTRISVYRLSVNRYPPCVIHLWVWTVFIPFYTDNLNPGVLTHKLVHWYQKVAKNNKLIMRTVDRASNPLEELL